MMKIVFSFVSFVCLAIACIGSAFAAGSAEAGKAKSVVCAACHGAQGVSAIPMNPNLAGQVPGYIASQLAAFKSGERVNAIMAGQVATLTQENMADLDAYYSSLPANTKTSLTDEDKVLAQEGQKIYRGGIADRDIPGCIGCHGPGGKGIPKNYPRVSAQHKDYLETQLMAYKKGERKGHNEIMWKVSFGLSEQEIKQLAAYMAGVN